MMAKKRMAVQAKRVVNGEIVVEAGTLEEAEEKLMSGDFDFHAKHRESEYLVGDVEKDERVWRDLSPEVPLFDTKDFIGLTVAVDYNVMEQALRSSLRDKQRKVIYVSLLVDDDEMLVKPLDDHAIRKTDFQKIGRGDTVTFHLAPGGIEDQATGIPKEGMN